MIQSTEKRDNTVKNSILERLRHLLDNLFAILQLSLDFNSADQWDYTDFLCELEHSISAG